MSYLEEAAALLREAAKKIESTYSDGFNSSLLIASQERIAMKFAQLAAIDRGVFPPDLAVVLLEQAREEAGRRRG